jgi:lactate dehydrogenase-like 2-hydroxyacid dehydrogenase
LAQATQRGIWVSNISSAGMGNALSCAEHIIYLTLALLRRCSLLDVNHVQLEVTSVVIQWPSLHIAEDCQRLPCSAPQMAKSVAICRIGQPLGQTLAGKRVLVFGLGNIGRELLPR